MKILILFGLNLSGWVEISSMLTTNFSILLLRIKTTLKYPMGLIQYRYPKNLKDALNELMLKITYYL